MPRKSREELLKYAKDPKYISVASRLELSPPAVGYSVERGEVIARQNGYRLIE